MVLQKSERNAGSENLTFLFSLDSHSKQAGDECHLLHTVSFFYTRYLAFPEHVHRYATLLMRSMSGHGWESNLSKLLLQKSIPPKMTLPIVYHFRALESKLRSPNLTKGDGSNDNCNAVAQQTLSTACLCCLRPYHAFWPHEARHIRQGWSMSSRHAAHFLLCARPQYAHFHRRSASFRIRENR